MSKCKQLLTNAVVLQLIVIHFTIIDSKLNLYVNKEEVQSLLGLNAEIYYVKNGLVNLYALQFVVPVPAEISALHFTWINLMSTPIPYSLAIGVGDTNVVENPLINISRRGVVPYKEQVFRVTLPCSGKMSAEVEIHIIINVTMSASANASSLILKRKKICLKSEINQITASNGIQEEDQFSDIEPNSSTWVTQINPLITAVGSACGILVLSFVAMLCYVFYARSQKGRQTSSVNYMESLTNVSSSKSGQAFLRTETPNTVTINKTGSHYSSFRGLIAESSAPLYRTLSVPVHIMNSEHRVSRLSEQIADLAVERRKIIIKEKLQEGTFGLIYKGIYIEDRNDLIKEKLVMIKTVSDQASQLQVSLFMLEGMKMCSLNHRNILSVFATCTDDPKRPLLLYPLTNEGNLKLLLQKCKVSPEGQVHTFLTQDLVQMAIQIVHGAIYLHKKKIIHRDLATRNCVVNASDGAFLVKIADNALSRDLFPNDYHCLGDNENRPIRWLAMESLNRNVYRESSDVWSFGVTLWELMTLSLQPYLEVDPFEMADYLRDGYRLYQPVNCPDKLYDIMICCWNAVPEARPTFPQLLLCLDDFYQTLGKYI